MSGHDFAVVDVETTGFSPAQHHRIVEIAVVRTDSRGRVLDEYATLVNPSRDLGPTHVHGLTAADVMPAPSFSEIAGDVLALLRGAVFVAHNARFDMAFVRAEMDRANIDLPDVPCLCTMRLAGEASPGVSSRRLGDLCSAFGIEIMRAHSALDDARATGKLLAACIERLTVRPLDLATGGAMPTADGWPNISPSGRSLQREESAARRTSEVPYIARLVSNLPPALGATPDLNAYLLLIDRVLEDRRVTAEEADALASLAAKLGLSRNAAVSAHERYLADLMRLALADGVISESERRDLNQVRGLLGISEKRSAELLGDVRASNGADGGAARTARANLAGKSICFTGEMTCTIAGEVVTRERAERVARANGLIVKNSVSRGLDFLVAADPDSMSGKAERARAYGVRIVAEPVFWQMVGVAAD